MIRLNRINNSEVIVNSDQIEIIEETPDLVLTLTSGKKIMVNQKLNEVIRMIVDYKSTIMARSMSGT
ncbi:MAG: flagellar FlbD family protein [Candidatus Eremiobacteraeota bacterium]|nr:flagellar FlbD family protein [Candidatus Eremiobacteraeota bacterium]